MYNTENLKQLYDRVVSCAIAIYGENPERVEVLENGIIEVHYSRSSCGEWEDYSEVISPDQLTTDLDILTQQRKEKEEIERIRRENERLKLEKERKELQERNDYLHYLKLKQKFDKSV